MLPKKQSFSKGTKLPLKGEKKIIDKIVYAVGVGGRIKREGYN